MLPYRFWSLHLKGTPEKLIDQLKHDGDGVDTYVEDFLLTYRTFVKTTHDITRCLLEWCSDYKLRDKVFEHSLVFVINKMNVLYFDIYSISVFAAF